MYCINLFHYDYCFNNRIIYIVMTEELITLETAKLLKEKGFNKSTLFAYKNNGNLYQDFNRIRLSYNSLPVPELCENFCACESDNPCYKCGTAVYLTSAPNQSFAQKWLRETKKLHVEVSYMHGDYWIYDILTIPEHDLVGLSDRPLVHYKSYEEALEAGIQEALKLI